MITSAKAGIFKPHTFLADIASKPTSYKHAMNNSGWLAAMQQEYQALFVKKNLGF